MRKREVEHLFYGLRFATGFASLCNDNSFIVILPSLF